MNVKELRIEITKLQDRINRIQEACSHPEDCVTYTAGSDTGNWCKYDDCYWRDYTCELCEKRWREDR